MEPLDEILHRHAITAVMHEYCRRADQNHNVEQAALFAPNGVANWGVPLQGRAAIAAFLSEALSKYSATSHHVSNIEIDFVDDTHATATSYVMAWHRHHDPDLDDVTLFGRYDDDWVLLDEGWRFASRSLRFAGGIGQAFPNTLPRRETSP